MAAQLREVQSVANELCCDQFIYKGDVATSLSRPEKERVEVQAKETREKDAFTSQAKILERGHSSKLLKPRDAPNT
jgi:hypothetical protein